MIIQCSDCAPVETNVKLLNIVKRKNNKFWRIVECTCCKKVFHYETARENVAFTNMDSGDIKK